MPSPVTPSSWAWPDQVPLGFLAKLHGDMVYSLPLQLQAGGTFMPGSKLYQWLRPGYKDGFQRAHAHMAPCVLCPQMWMSVWKTPTSARTGSAV